MQKICQRIIRKIGLFEQKWQRLTPAKNIYDPPLSKQTKTNPYRWIALLHSGAIRLPYWKLIWNEKLKKVFLSSGYCIF